jgi:hypothetical protein
LKPPEIVVVIVDFPELPLTTLIDVGDAVMMKLGVVPVTVKDTAVFSVNPLLVPVIVNG